MITYLQIGLWCAAIFLALLGIAYVCPESGLKEEFQSQPLKSILSILYTAVMFIIAYPLLVLYRMKIAIETYKKYKGDRP